MQLVTYRELRDYLNLLSQDELDENVSIGIFDEFYGIRSIEITEDDDAIENGHLYLLVQED